MAKKSKHDLYNPEYDIGGLGPHTNSTYGYFQYLVADDIKLDNEAYLNKGTVANNFLVKGRIKATEVDLRTDLSIIGLYMKDFESSISSL